MLIPASRIAIRSAAILLLGWSSVSLSTTSVSVADAQLDVSFYADASCLLTIDALVQSGNTVIDADVDIYGSRMLIHCDTVDGRRLTLLARGDSLNLSQRAPLLSREAIAEGEFGMIAWLTRSGVHYTDDSAPRRYVIGGSVKLRKSPPADVAGVALNSSKQAYASISGILEPIVKADEAQTLQPTPAAPTPQTLLNDPVQEIETESAEIQQAQKRVISNQQ